MTVETLNTFSGPYVPNGVTTAFPFTFTPGDASEVVVEIDGGAVATGLYTVTLNAGNEGGTVTFYVAPTGASLIIRLDPSFEQNVSFTNSGPFLSESIEEGLDRGAIRDQWLKQQVENLGTLQGDPGGNVMAIGLFMAAIGLSIPLGTNLVQTSGHTQTGMGAGLYVADAAVDAAYTAAHPRASFISANGRGFRLYDDQPWYITHFGVIGDGNVANAANNIAGLNAAQDYIATRKRDGVGFSSGGHALWWGFNDVHIGANTWDITYPFRVQCEGTGGSGAGNSVIRTTGTTAVRIQANDTTGAAGTQAASTHRGAEAIIDGLVVVGSYAGGAESEAHGFHLRGEATLTNCQVYSMQGDGYYIVADSGTSIKGNANCFKIEKCSASGCRQGFYDQGGDTNAGSFSRCNSVANRASGFREAAFIGNYHAAHHSAGNARTPYNDGVTVPATYVSQGGNIYFAIQGQEVWCSTHAPTGAATNNQGWGFYVAGGASPTTGVPAWFNGISVRASGGYHVDGAASANQSRFYGCYSEDDQVNLNGNLSAFRDCFITYMWTVAAGAIVGSGANYDSVNATRPEPGGMTALRSSLNIYGDLKANNPGKTVSFGPVGGASDGYQYFENSNAFYHKIYRNAQVQYGEKLSGHTIGFRWDINTGLLHEWYVNGALVLSVGVNGANLPAGKVLKVNGVQVIGARQTGWTAATGTATRSTFATGSVTLPQLAEHVKALIDDLMTTGVIGA